jgi:hypothetical protein
MLGYFSLIWSGIESTVTEIIAFPVVPASDNDDNDDVG